MHIHTFNYDNGKKSYPLLIANGITGVRDMGTPLNDIIKLRKDVEDRKILGPRVFAGGPILSSVIPPGMENNPLIASAVTKEATKKTIDSLINSGVDFIKINYADKNILNVISKECREKNISFVGHLPILISAQEASIAGINSIEHLGGSGAHGILRSCSEKEEVLKDSVKKWTADLSQFDELVFFRSSFTKTILDSYDDQRAIKLLQLFVKNKTWQTPTLVVLDSTWNWNSNSLSEEDNFYGIKIRQKQFELVRMMQQQGVGILAGTDLPIDKPQLANELETLVIAGLSPFQALKTATINPAIFLNKEKILGTIEKGKLADLVLLDGNPITDIRNIKHIHAVIINGKLLRKSDLERLKLH
jgi:hypothetical protein